MFKEQTQVLDVADALRISQLQETLEVTSVMIQVQAKQSVPLRELGPTSGNQIGSNGKTNTRKKQLLRVDPQEMIRRKGRRCYLL